MFRFYDPYIRERSQARKRETVQYITAKLTQPVPNVEAPLHRDTALEKVVNTRRDTRVLLHVGSNSTSLPSVKQNKTTTTTTKQQQQTRKTNREKRYAY